MWSLVIAKDLFTAFQDKGILTPGPARPVPPRRCWSPAARRTPRCWCRTSSGRDYDFRAYEEWLNAG